MSIEAFPAIPSDELDSSTIKAATPDKDVQNILQTGQVPTDIPLAEYSGESNYEPYSGIILDPEKNTFKTVSGMFRDKKEFYEKLSKRGYVVRKVFEKKVFDWIEENAKTTMEAYLMFSTAFSKWKGNNLLNGYYTKLLNDIPQLNREKQKGNPNSRDDDFIKGESVLAEDNNPQDYLELSKVYKSKLIDLPKYLDKKRIITDIIENGLKLTDVLKANEVSDINFIKKYLKDNYITPKDNTIPNTPNGVPYNITAVALDSNRNEIGNEILFNKIPVFLTSVIPSRDINGSIAKFLSQNPTLTYNLFKQINKPIRNSEGDILYDAEGHTLNGAPEQSGFDKNARFIKVSIPNRFEFEVDAQQIRDIYTSLRQIPTKTDSMIAQSIASANMKAKSKADDVAMLNSLFNPELQAVTHTVNYQTQKNPIKVLKQASLKDILNILYNNGVDIFDKKECLDKVEKDLEEYTKLENDLKVLSNKNTTTAVREKIFKKYGVVDKLDCDKKIKIIQKSILNQYEPPVDYKVKQYYSTDTEENRKKEAGLQTDTDTTITNDAVTAKLAQQGVKFGGMRAKYNKNESVDSIPVVDDIIPAKAVNYNATQSYANQPIDGVITNPGAIQTGGTFMAEQDEHWGWVHDELNQDLFDGTKLKSDVRQSLLEIAEKFKNSLGLNSIEPVDIYFTGSSANFNYNDSSDIDLHLVYDFEEVGINAEILIKYFIAKKQVFNNDYNITVKGVPVEVGVENLNEPIVTSAIYSLTKDAWILEPEYAEQLLPQPDMQQYYEIVQKIEKAIETRNSTEIGKVWDELYDIRKNSLAKEGEYGKGNALFKKLRNLGYLDRLKKAYYSSASDELSLESLKEML